VLAKGVFQNEQQLSGDHMKRPFCVRVVVVGTLLGGLVSMLSQSPEITGLSLTNNVLTVAFAGGELETAPTLAGPWTGTGNTNGQYSESIAGSQSNRFYRVLGQSLPPAPGSAGNPNPANGATGVAVDADLSWTAGSGAMSHHVYFGTSSPGAYRGDQAGTTFDPGTLTNSTTYYWRIDEVNAGGTNTGTVWSFATEAQLLLVISNLNPPTNAVALSKLAVGQFVYTDRTYTFTGVGSLGGQAYLQTANNDKQSTANLPPLLT